MTRSGVATFDVGALPADRSLRVPGCSASCVRVRPSTAVAAGSAAATGVGHAGGRRSVGAGPGRSRHVGRAAHLRRDAGRSVFRARDSSRRRTGCFRWTSGGDRRRAGSSEVLGANFIERDAMTRRMQYHGDMRAEWDSYGPDTEAIATAFVRGINAWVDIASEQPARRVRPGRLATRALETGGPAESHRCVRGERERRRRSVPRAAGGLARRAARRGAAPGRLASPPRRPAWARHERRSPTSSAMRCGRSGRPPVFSGLAAPVPTVRLDAGRTTDATVRLKPDAGDASA